MPQIALAVKGVASLIAGAIAPTSIVAYKATKFAIFSALATGVSYGANAVQRALLDERRGLDRRRDYRHTIFAPNAPSRVILGRAKVGGHICYFGSLGRDARMGLVLGYGKYSAIENVFLYGEEIQMVKSGNKLIPRDIPANAKWKEVRNGNTTWLLEIYPYIDADGSQGSEMRFTNVSEFDAQGYDYGGIIERNSDGDPLDEFGNMVDDINYTGNSDNSNSKISPFPEWTSDHDLDGYSWCYVKMRQSDYGNDVTKRVYDRFPEFTFVVKGLEFQTPNSTGVLQAAKWSENAADVRYWIETNILGLEHDRFDFGSFASAQTLCNQTVTIADADIPPNLRGEYTKSGIRYSINGVVEFGEPMRALRDQLDLAWSGELIEAGGKYVMRPGVNRVSSQTINADELKIESELIPSPTLANRINAIIGILEQSKDNNYNELPLAKFVDMPAQTRDLQERESELHYRFINNAYSAGRLQANAMRLSRNPLAYSLTMKPDELLEIYSRIPTDIVTVSDSEYGFTNKKFAVREISITDWIVTLGMVEFIDGTYADTLVLPPLHTRNFRLADRTFVPKITGLTLTETDSKIVVSWDEKPVPQTEIQYRKSGETEWLYISTTGSMHEFIPVSTGTYQVRVRHVNAYGYYGAWLQGEIEYTGINVEGADGTDGLGIEYIFTATATANLAANKRPSNTWGYDSGGTATGQVWTDGAPSLTAALPYLWRAQRKISGAPNAGDSVSENWKMPAIVGRYGPQGAMGLKGIKGVDGVDADGVEYIFTATATANLAANKRPSNTWGYDSGGTATGQVWTDGAPSLTAALPYLWRAQRKISGAPNAGDSVSENWTVPVVVGRYGDTGAQGLAGATITVGTGVPSDTNGKNGDLYVQTDGIVWRKTAGSWAKTGADLTGPPNARTYSLGVVQAGSTPAVPAGAIDGSIGLANDGRFWELSSGAWALRGDLTGPVGPGGGSIRTGAGAPANSLGNNGDLYIRNNGQVWTKSGGSWTNSGIDLISDMVTAAGARIYSLGAVTGNSPAVPAMAVNGSIGVANDGRFWELVNGAWVYRDDLTGPKGNKGTDGLALGKVLSRSFSTNSNLSDNEFWLERNAIRIGWGTDRMDWPYLDVIPVGTSIAINLDGDTTVSVKTTSLDTPVSTGGHRYTIEYQTGSYNDAISGLTPGSNYNLAIGYSLGDPGLDAWGKGFSREWANNSFDVSRGSGGKFNVHQNGVQVHISEDNDAVFFANVAVGSSIWFDGNAYRWRGRITGKNKIIGLTGGNTWRFDTEPDSAILPSARAGNSYQVVFTSSGVASDSAIATGMATIPGPPVNANVVRQGDGGLVISWQAPISNGGSPITSYKIDSSSDGGNSFTLLAEMIEQNIRSYTDSGLGTNATRHYRIYAVNVNGVSTEYAQTTGNTSITAGNAPSAVRNLRVQTFNNDAIQYAHQITLNWSAPTSSGLSGTSRRSYRVEVSNDGSNWSFYGDVSTGTRVYGTGLFNSTIYFRVAAVNNLGIIGDFESISFTIIAPTVTYPQSPIIALGNSFLTSSNVARPAISIDITFQTSSSSTRYVYISKDGISYYRTLITTQNGLVLIYAYQQIINQDRNGTIRPTQVTVNLEPSTMYYVRVNARGMQSSNGYSEPAQASIMTNPNPGPASQPILFTVNPSNNWTNILSWQPPSALGGLVARAYTIEVSEDNRTSRKITSGVSASARSFRHDVGIDAATNYRYRIRCDTALTDRSSVIYNGDWASINIVSASRPGGTPSAPRNMSVALNRQRNRGYDIDWNTPSSNGGSAILGYRLERGTTGDGLGDYTESNDITGSDTEFHDVLAHQNLAYNYRVAARNANGIGEWAEVAGTVPTAEEVGFFVDRAIRLPANQALFSDGEFIMWAADNDRTNLFVSYGSDKARLDLVPSGGRRWEVRFWATITPIAVVLGGPNNTINGVSGNLITIDATIADIFSEDHLGSDVIFEGTEHPITFTPKRTS